MSEYAIDQVINFHNWECNDPECTAGNDARAELSALRARVEQAERESDEARARVAALEAVKQEAAEVVMRYYGDDIGRFKAEIVARHIMEIDTAQPATLTPRRCGTCCTEAAKAMRESIKQHIEKERALYASNSEACLRVGNMFGHAADNYAAVTLRDVLSEIDAIPLPSCDGCNPLAPENDAALYREGLEEIERIWVRDTNRSADTATAMYRTAAQYLNIADESADDPAIPAAPLERATGAVLDPQAD